MRARRSCARCRLVEVLGLQLARDAVGQRNPAENAIKQSHRRATYLVLFFASSGNGEYVSLPQVAAFFTAAANAPPAAGLISSGLKTSAIFAFSKVNPIA